MGAHLGGYVSVAKAATELGVSPGRVRELVAAGQLRAVKYGRDVLVDSSSVRHRVRVVRPAAGRPLSPRMGWAMLWFASGRRPEWISSAELVRIRRYLRTRDLSEWPRLLGRRAEVYSVRILPGLVGQLLNQSGVSSGGISAAVHYGAQILPSGDEAEFYVSPKVFGKLRDEHRMKLDPELSNVVLRVPLLARPELLAEPVMPLAVAVADLLDSGGERSVRAGRRLLATMDEQL